MRKGILKLDIRQMDRQAGDQMDGQMDKKRQTIYINSIGIFLAQVLRTHPTRSPLRSKFIFFKIRIPLTFQGNHMGLKELQTAQQNFQGSKKCPYFQKDSNVINGPSPKTKKFWTQKWLFRVPRSFPEFFRMFLNYGGEGSADPILGNFHSFYALFFQ